MQAALRIAIHRIEENYRGEWHHVSESDWFLPSILSLQRGLSDNGKLSCVETRSIVEFRQSNTLSNVVYEHSVASYQNQILSDGLGILVELVRVRPNCDGPNAKSSFNK